MEIPSERLWIAFVDPETPVTQIQELWQDDDCRHLLIESVVRDVSKTGSVANTPLERHLAHALSGDQFSILYCAIRDYSQRHEHEWRPSFISVFQMAESDLPPLDVNRAARAYARGLYAAIKLEGRSEYVDSLLRKLHQLGVSLDSIALSITSIRTVVGPFSLPPGEDELQRKHLSLAEYASLVGNRAYYQWLVGRSSELAIERGESS